MKVNSKKTTSHLPQRTTNVASVGLGIVKITHHQSIRQSHNYQSAEVSYGIEIHCHDDEDEIEKIITRCEETVEQALLVKFKEQGKLLNTLSA